MTTQPPNAPAPAKQPFGTRLRAQIAEMSAAAAPAPAQAAPPPAATSYTLPDGQAVIINNNVAASASAGFGYPGWHRCPRQQSPGVHAMLFLFTAGMGNLFYSAYKSSRRCRFH